jgi:hypothetical protein
MKDLRDVGPEIKPIKREGQVLPDPKDTLWILPTFIAVGQLLIERRSRDGTDGRHLGSLTLN